MFYRLRKIGQYKDYMNISFNGFHLQILREQHDENFLKICCQGPSNDLTPFTPINCSQFAKVYRFTYEGQDYYYKLFLQRNWREPIRNFFLRTRADRALRGHLLLQENGFWAPRINVVGKKGSSNFIVAQAVTNIGSIPEFLHQMSSSPPSEEKTSKKRDLIRQLGHTIGRLHKLGISHGDLRLGNVIINDSDPCQLRYFFLDNERTVRFRRLPKRKRIKNLVQANMLRDLILTKTDRLRFFQAYLQENPELISKKRLWIARIVNKTNKRVARRIKKRSIRPEIRSLYS